MQPMLLGYISLACFYTRFGHIFACAAFPVISMMSTLTLWPINCSKSSLDFPQMTGQDYLLQSGLSSAIVLAYMLLLISSWLSSSVVCGGYVAVTRVNDCVSKVDDIKQKDFIAFIPTFADCFLPRIKLNRHKRRF